MTLFRTFANYLAAPNRESFEPATLDDLREAAHYMDFDSRDLTIDRAAVEAAIDAAEAGASVLLASDEDGWYFAAEGDSLLELPYDTLSLSERIDAVDAARALGADDARADREAGTWPATARRVAMLHESVLGDDADPRVAGYRDAYERED